MITLIYKKLEFIIIINCRVREGKTWHAPGFKKQKSMKKYKELKRMYY